MASTDDTRSLRSSASVVKLASSSSRADVISGESVLGESERMRRYEVNSGLV